MDALLRLWPLPLGFIAGLLAVPPLFRWLLLLLASLGRLPPHLGTEAQRPRKAGIGRAIVHPVPWLLLLAVVVGVPALIASPARAEWLWFLTGVLAAPTVNGILVYRAVQRVRARRGRDRPP